MRFTQFELSILITSLGHFRRASRNNGEEIPEEIYTLTERLKDTWVSQEYDTSRHPLDMD